MSSALSTASSTARLTRSGSPTKPRSTCRSMLESGSTTVRVALRATTMLPSLPHRPMALPPSAPIQPTICLLIEPASTISTISTVASSVTRRPALNSRLDAELVEHPADLRPAAMHHDRLEPRLLEEHDVLGEILGRGAVAHGVAAIFDDHDLLVVALHVRQGLDQDLGLHMHVGEGFGHVGSSLRRIGGARLLAQAREPPESRAQERGTSAESATRAQPIIRTMPPAGAAIGNRAAPRKARIERSPAKSATPRRSVQAATRPSVGWARPGAAQRDDADDRRRVHQQEARRRVEVGAAGCMCRRGRERDPAAAATAPRARSRRRSAKLMLGDSPGERDDIAAGRLRRESAPA